MHHVFYIPFAAIIHDTVCFSGVSVNNYLKSILYNIKSTGLPHSHHRFFTLCSTRIKHALWLDSRYFFVLRFSSLREDEI